MAPGAQHSVSVAAIIVNNDGQALMIKRRDNAKWEPPGGVLELGESIIYGLRREIREETGLDIEPDRLTGVYKKYEPRHHRPSLCPSVGLVVAAGRRRESAF